MSCTGQKNLYRRPVRENNWNPHLKDITCEVIIFEINGSYSFYWSCLTTGHAYYERVYCKSVEGAMKSANKKYGDLLYGDWEKLEDVK